MDFSIMRGMDATATAPPTRSLPPRVLGERGCAMMTRCECAGVSFGDLAERMRAEGLSVPDACRRTGCGQLCTACLPDLESYLSSGA
jgi:NAD(P)H-nitrite reductase large subunit